MKSLKIITVLVLSTFLYTQDLDQTYLDSLPEDIRADVISKMDLKEDIEKPIYRRASSSLDKATVDLEERQKIFGYNFFDTIQTSFMPINEPNLGEEYILDFGDVLEVQIIGQKDSIETYAIKRNGSINIPDIGIVKLSGLSLNEASRFIKAKVADAFIGTEAYVTLSEIRDINILISGNAFNPGIYTLNGNSNILHALSMAGGINKYGSYRNILHLRNNEVIGKLDIYNLLINGKYNFEKNLKSGDVVFVDTVGNLVEVMGAFKRPGFYELSDDEPLSQALFFANGISKNADLTNIYIQRVVNGNVDSIKLDNIDGLNNLYANDGDKIIVRQHDHRSIEIVGSVVNPGKYFMSEGESIFDAIEKAGGYTEGAYKFGAIYENKVAKKISENALDFLYQEFLRNLILMGQQNLGEYDILSTIQAAKLMNDIEPSGRIIVDFVNPESSNTFIVQNGDKITIPEKTNQVYVFGEISSEGAVSYVQGEDVSYYLDKKGGFNSHADKSRIFIIHPNGVTQNIELRRNVFQSITKKNDVYPGSIIYVPQSIDNPSIRRMSAQAYASILGNIAISLASLNSIQ